VKWTAIHCPECNRANRADAKRCMWCGAAVTSDNSAAASLVSSVEVEYVRGIERLDNPAPVRIAVDGSGLVISELIPGTRSTRIQNADIIGARAVAKRPAGEPSPRRFGRWWRGLHSFASDDKLEGSTDGRRGHTLSIRYRDGEAVRTAVFQREDTIGLALINGLARLIGSVARSKGRRSDY